MSDLDRVTKHTIAEISYAADRLECSCGAVMRASAKYADWTAHRRENGLSAKSIDAHDLRGKSPRGKAFTISRQVNEQRRLAPVTPVVREVDHG